ITPSLRPRTKTRAIDLWLLVPVGIGLNRLLPQQRLPPEEWGTCITRFLATDEWRRRFYGPPVQRGFWDEPDRQEKTVDHEGLKEYFVQKLRTIFPGVAPKPLTLRNSRNAPLFLLCFAAANERGAPTALKIANHLLKE